MSAVTDYDKQKSKTRADELLALLEDGPKTTAELIRWNHRYSASVRVLRERGHRIERETNDDGEIVWRKMSYTPMVEVTEAIKEAYYKTPHWRTKRLEAIRRDGGSCVFCGFSLVVEVHHWRYELFDEDVKDLTTVCDECHRWIHENENVTIHFPHYVTPEVAARIEREAT